MEAIHRLAASNSHVQQDVLERGAERLLMQLLKKRNAESLQEKTAMALWALAGDDINEKREMANGIGVQTLIDFVNSMSENLHYIGSEGLGVLAQVRIAVCACWLLKPFAPTVYFLIEAPRILFVLLFSMFLCYYTFVMQLPYLLSTCFTLVVSNIVLICNTASILLSHISLGL